MRKRHRHAVTSHQNPANLAPRVAKVIFCVQGVKSPCLSNIFLHHVLDEWFENEVKPRLNSVLYGVTAWPLSTGCTTAVIGIQTEKAGFRVARAM
jgi:hypothetical protein